MAVTHIATTTTLKHVSLSHQYLVLAKCTLFESVRFRAAFKLVGVSELLLKRY